MNPLRTFVVVLAALAASPSAALADIPAEPTGETSRWVLPPLSSQALLELLSPPAAMMPQDTRWGRPRSTNQQSTASTCLPRLAPRYEWSSSTRSSRTPRYVARTGSRCNSRMPQAPKPRTPVNCWMRSRHTSTAAPLRGYREFPVRMEDTGAAWKAPSTDCLRSRDGVKYCWRSP